MIKLTGSQNPLVKEVRSLKMKKDREQLGRFFIEGSRFVQEALNEKAALQYVMVSETFASGDGSSHLLRVITASGVTVYLLPDSLFETVSDTKTPQGILAVLKLNRRDIKQETLNGGLFLILDCISDPGNMGTILRAADAAGCEGIIVTDGSADLYNPKVLRSTMGSIFHVPVYDGVTPADACEILKSAGYRILASKLEGAVSLYDTDLTGPVALVIGSEAHGIGMDIQQSADLFIKIPMKGRAESLNASVAAGVMIFEAARQRIQGHMR